METQHIDSAPHASATGVPADLDLDSQTPLMRQFWELKAQAPGALLFFRMGDFYELFGDDAVEAARLLEITLTSRDKGKANPLPMAGVPHHSAQGYLQRLLKAGRKVAIAEQMEDPATVKGPKAIVKREIIRVFTPAVQFDAETSEAQYLATVVPVSTMPDTWVLAVVDAATGELLLSHALPAPELSSEILRLPIRHFLRIGHRLPEEARLVLDSSVLLEDLPSNTLSDAQAREWLRRQFEVSDLDAFFGTFPGEALLAAGLVVQYACRSQRVERLGHLRVPAPLRRPKAMELGPRAAEHLDLVTEPGSATPTLFGFINRTRSALGARELRRWMLHPLRSLESIEERQSSVRALSESGNAAERASTLLGELYDLERLAGRVMAKLANPRDTLSVGRSLLLLPRLLTALEPVRGKTGDLGSRWRAIENAHAVLGGLGERILRTQRDDAPLVPREGGIFNRGTDGELDRLIDLTENGQRFLVELEAREREATGISSLKVRYNRVFGYYIEVTQAHLSRVPAHYQRKQTMVGAERFFTEELKKFEDELVHAESKQRALEQRLFEELLEAVASATAPLMELARELGELDALVALARLTEEPGWIFPRIDDSLDLHIEAGRHPLVDAGLRGKFVPNTVALSAAEGRRTLLITGPNMGGKSTIMRQAALIVILGQMGAPVPAAQARWGWVSSLHTRIGAHDAIARGQSTFMVEMSELAHLLHHADERSLVILDEIGRGTSTYDGMSVAWATLEWICTKIRSRTLFATHYHELTQLEGKLDGLRNAHLATEGTRDASRRATLRFLYELREGPAAESFGVHVAELAGLPKAVISRAWEVLEGLEAQTHGPGAGGSPAGDQLSLFSAAPASALPARTVEKRVEVLVQHPLIEELRNLDVNQMTPIQALNFLHEARAKVRG